MKIDFALAMAEICRLTAAETSLAHERSAWLLMAEDWYAAADQLCADNDNQHEVGRPN